MNIWIAGARPRTLGASVSPVLAGVALSPSFPAWRAFACFGVALGFQVGVNYANDYFDGVRGVDTAARMGPVRLTASGLARPRAVATAAALSFLAAFALGLALAIAVDLRLLLIGAAALLAAVLYSGGPRPYASMGLGEVFVFVFFGLVAVCGTVYALTSRVPAGAWWAGAAMGSFAVAILVANNLRDLPTDAAAGKRTLAVRIGDGPTRALFRVALVAPFALVVAACALGALPWWSSIALTAFVPAALPLGPAPAAEGSSSGEVRQLSDNCLTLSAKGPALVAVLIRTSIVQVVFAALLAAGVIAGR